jgi:hypothetical protein
MALDLVGAAVVWARPAQRDQYFFCRSDFLAIRLGTIFVL